LLIKLRYLDTWNQQRQAIASYYQRFLSQIPGIIPPQELAGSTSVWNQYTIRVLTEGRNGTSAAYREQIRNSLQAKQVGSMVYYPYPLHLQPVYQHLGYQPGQLPVAEQAGNEVLSLPMFPELTTQQQEQVIYALKDSVL
jgi:dTDP-4-amino-4,6-dideoxygalactose transaminase